MQRLTSLICLAALVSTSHASTSACPKGKTSFVLATSTQPTQYVINEYSISLATVNISDADIFTLSSSGALLHNSQFQGTQQAEVQSTYHAKYGVSEIILSDAPPNSAYAALTCRIEPANGCALECSSVVHQPQGDRNVTENHFYSCVNNGSNDGDEYVGLGQPGKVKASSGCTAVTLVAQSVSG